MMMCDSDPIGLLSNLYDQYHLELLRSIHIYTHLHLHTSSIQKHGLPFLHTR